MFEKLWTLQTEGAVPSGMLPNAKLGPAYGIFGRQIVELASGQVAWTAEGAPVGIDLDAVLVVRRDGDRWTAIERRKLTSGELITGLPLKLADSAPVQLRAEQTGLALAQSSLVYSSLGRLQAFAIDTGLETWKFDTGSTQGDVVVSGSLVGVVGSSEVSVLDSTSGEVRWRAKVDGGVVPSPRGGFFGRRGSAVVEFDADGKELRTVAGRIVSAAGALVASVVDRDIVVMDDSGREVQRVRPADASDYVAAPGICGTSVVYFRSKDSTVWWRDANGTEKPVVIVAKKTGVTSEGVTTAGATLTTSPRCSGAVLLIQDWSVSAFRIPTP